MKKILVLGIGNAQTDLVKRLSGRCTLHALSYTLAGRGKKFVDRFQLIDIKNEQAVLKYAKAHNIDVVYSVGSDLAMVTSAWVSHELQLPSFVTPDVARTCNSKNEMRRYFEGMHYNIPYQILEEPDDIDSSIFPCILKPVDSQGQRGIFLVHDKKQLSKRFPQSLKFSQSKKVIAEKYIKGPEVSVNVYLAGGEIQFFVISDRIAWPDLPGGIIHKHRIPSRHASKEVEFRVHQVVSDVVSKIGIKNGPVYFQIKLSEDNEPKLIEVTPRLDGCHMWRLIKYAMRVDLLQTNITHLIDNTFNNPEPEIKEGTWILEFMCESPGMKLKKDKYHLDNSVYHEWYYEEGDRVEPMNTYMEKCGYQIYKE